MGFGWTLDGVRCELYLGRRFLAGIWEGREGRKKERRRGGRKEGRKNGRKDGRKGGKKGGKKGGFVD